MPKFVSIANDDNPERDKARRASIAKEVEAELGRRGMRNTHTEAPQGPRGMREHALGRHGAPAAEAPSEDELIGAELGEEGDDQVRQEITDTLQALRTGGYHTPDITKYVIHAISQQGLSPQEIIRRVFETQGMVRVPSRESPGRPRPRFSGGDGDDAA